MAELKNRNAHEEAFALGLGRVANRHRHQLEDGLTADFAAPPGYWEQVQRETEEELTALLLLLFITAADQHGLDDATVPVLAQGYAGAQAREVAAGYVTTSRERLGRWAAEWRERGRPTGPGQAAGERPTAADVRDMGLSIFGPDRIEGITVGEVTAAVSAGGEAAARAAGQASDDDLWRTEQDDKVCPICAPLEGAKRSRWSLKFPAGPPAHTRCRCWLDYARDRRK